MTIDFQPPLGPTLGGGNPYNPINRDMATAKSPFWTVANQFLPRNLKDVIRWARFITSQSPVTTEVIRKLSTYPITEFVIDTEKPATKDKYTQIIDSFGLKSVLHDVGFEYHTIGNVFLSIYFPVHRTLTCPHCNANYNSKTATFLSFQNYQFTGDCPSCGIKATFRRTDTKNPNVKDMNLIRWDPLNISVAHNPITGEYAYYYTIPNDIKRRIQKGDRLFIDTVPWEFVEAVKDNKDFKFDNNNLFHLKNMSAGALVEGSAVPPLISQFPLVYYTTMLRRANESVASDYMAPLRVIFPQAQTANSDPVISMSLRNFSGRMQEAMARHRQDNNHIAFAPIPIGYQTISGEGKTLLVSQEIAQAEQSMLLSLGVSQELLSGTTNWTSSTVGLRMLENTLNCYVGQIQALLDWIFARASKYLTLETCKVTLAPFRLTDDDNLRQTLANLAAAGQASFSTLYESYGMDYEEELKKVREDAVRSARNKVLTEAEIERATFLAAKQAKEQLDQNGDYKSALSEAQQYAEQLAGADLSTRRQVLNQLKLQDFALYLMTSKLLEEYNSANRQEMAAQQSVAAAQGDPSAGGASETEQKLNSSQQPQATTNPTEQI